MTRTVYCALSTLFFILVATVAQATIYYIAPAGSDAANGTSTGTPWKTFAHAIPLLDPGDTLTVMDGVYTKAVNGLIAFTCGTGGVVNGTVSQPITIKAQNERKAHINGDGSLITLFINTCSYWVIDGLHLSAADNTTNSNIDGSVLYAKTGDHLTLKRLLIEKNNRYFNGHGITASVTNSLIEENELYTLHRHGMAMGTSGFNTVRRNYFNSRSYDDIPGGKVSGDISRGDTGISCYPCHDTIFENNISEGWDMGFDIQATSNSANNKWLGDIALNNGYGAVFTARNDNGNSINTMPQNTQLTNFLVVGSDHGPSLFLRSNKNTHCDQCTLINLSANTNSIAIDGDLNSTGLGDGLPTVFGSNILIWGTAGKAFSLTNQSNFGFDYVKTFITSLGFTPGMSDPRFSHMTLQDPALGTCRVFIPSTSPAYGSGLGGNNIGATIINRYVDGVITGTPLWDTTSGAFPCGAQVAGVNDIAGSSCFDVHRRLNVNYNGCTLPGQVVAPNNILVFTTQPVSTTIAATMPSVVVTMKNGDTGVTVTSFVGSVVLSLVGSSGTLSGTLTQTAVAGIATFNDLAVDTLGTYTLNATATGATAATSNIFSITATPLPVAGISPYRITRTR